MHIHRFCCCFALFLLPAVVLSAVRLVPGVYVTIQAAVDAASDGDTIVIADGIYSGAGNTGIHWDATNKHLLIRSENGPEHCIVDCMQEGRGFLLNQGQNRRDVIEGLSITRGMVFGAGGAIFIYSASPVIRNCLLINNMAEGYHDSSYSGCGGAIIVLNESDPLIQGNIIRNNTASNLGGGVLFAEFAAGEISNNIIDGNRALDDWGGGIALWNNASPRILGNLIIRNTCSGFDGGKGGGIYLDHTTTLVANNTIAFNATTGNEYGDGYGGGICIGNWAAPVIKNCIIWYNRSGASSMNLYFDPKEWLDISYCNVEYDLGHIFDLEPHTNMDITPEFMDTVNGDFRLKWSSLCINRGDPDTSGLFLPTIDLAGNQRIYEDRIDIGAYEFMGPMRVGSPSPLGAMHCYPNPAKTSFYIEFTGISVGNDMVIRIFDLRGILVRETSINPAPIPLEVDVSAQPTGMYILTLHVNGEEISRKKIIKK